MRNLVPKSIFKPRKSVLFSKNGFTIPDLVVALGLGAIISFVIFSLITQTQKKTAEANTVATFMEKANQIKTVLAQEQSFKNTITSALNPNMSCLISANRTIPCNAVFVGSSFSALHDRIAVYDGSPSPGQILYDSRVGSTAGFTEKGAACNNFSIDGAGNDDCPIGYLINWRISTAGTFSGVSVIITAKLIYNPSEKNPTKRLINATLSSPLGRYDVVVEQKLESLIDMNKLTCTQDGLTMPLKSARLFYKRSLAPFGNTCEPETRTCTVINDAAVLTGSAQYSNCAQDCKGAWQGCSVPCGGGTQAFVVITPNNQWGTACAFSDGQTQNCNLGSCAGGPGIDCVGSWSACVNGFRTYTVSTWQNSTGLACPEPNNTVESCGVSCEGSWGACVNGVQTFSHTISPSGGGRLCAFANGATQTCGVSCQGAWSACVNHVQNYSISVPASGGGANCPNAQGDIQACVSCTWAANEGPSHQNYVMQLLEKFVLPEAKACVTACSGALGCNASLCCPLAANACGTAGDTTTCKQYDACTDSCAGAVRTLTCSCF